MCDDENNSYDNWEKKKKGRRYRKTDIINSGKPLQKGKKKRVGG